MSDNIPFDIQVDIMNRLPVKSLMQFRSLSKSWKAAIDCNDFIRRYGFHEVENHNVMIVLLNPSIKRSVGVSVPSYMDQPDSPKMVLGFGVRPDTLDPTILKINYPYYGEGPWYVSVFTLSSGRWTILGNNHLPRQTIRLKRSGQACVGGKIYWPASERFVNDHGGVYKIYMLVSFDLIIHRFRVVNLPEQLSDLIPFPFTISHLGNSLVVSSSYYLEDIRFLCAWALKIVGGFVTSFQMLFNIPFPVDHVLKLLGFTKDEEPIVEANVSQQLRRSLQVFVPNAESFQNVGVEGDSGSFAVGHIKESLILFNFNHRELIGGFNLM
ncbi:F-box domain-containing protein [Artemisia annua]|uniref:F-box domain-containing protein n=1 Tax=Artemisia annua TaxID=35608 RepID=A0A2U1LGN0_ARTAN|nr:F-box domain-containing protein [Artemisia annua]